MMTAVFESCSSPPSSAMASATAEPLETTIRNLNAAIAGAECEVLL